ncbi:hypothetical protein HELRODRAFT_176884 [Helobdella robusta]|uniref:Protein quiver n=1 Tax=Helobdella robusta TaxID=6412 RepID=T1FB05_HELRO|nr:hypothetical protein HELRODRAFT_176884 [Helobdella robusta]ESN98416.1 hypothetical protein HELRODRAFT_176884 [Helobdella robusta]
MEVLLSFLATQLFLITSLKVNSVDGIQCYQCINASICKDPFVSNHTGMQFCEGNYCVKALIDGNVIARLCIDQSSFTSECISGDYDYTKTCVCKRNLCNGASGHRTTTTSHSYIFVATVANCLAAFWLHFFFQDKN